MHSGVATDIAFKVEPMDHRPQTQSEAKRGTRFLLIPGMRARAGTKQGFFAGLLLPALHYMTLHRVEQAPACSVALIILAAFSAQTWVVLLLLWEQNVCKTTKAITCFLVTVP